MTSEAAQDLEPLGDGLRGHALTKNTSAQRTMLAANQSTPTSSMHQTMLPKITTPRLNIFGEAAPTISN